MTVRGTPLVMAPTAFPGMAGSVAKPPAQAYEPQPSVKTRPTAGAMADWHASLEQPGMPPLLFAPRLPPVQPMAAAPRVSAWKRKVRPSAPPPQASCSVRLKERKKPPASNSGAGAHSAPTCPGAPGWHEPEDEQQKGACVSAACVLLSTRAQPTACHVDSTGKYAAPACCSWRAAAALALAPPGAALGESAAARSSAALLRDTSTTCA